MTRGARHAKIAGKSILGRAKSKCKGPEVGGGLVFSGTECTRLGWEEMRLWRWADRSFMRVSKGTVKSRSHLEDFCLWVFCFVLFCSTRD